LLLIVFILAGCEKPKESVIITIEAGDVIEPNVIEITPIKSVEPNVVEKEIEEASESNEVEFAVGPLSEPNTLDEKSLNVEVVEEPLDAEKAYELIYQKDYRVFSDLIKDSHRHSSNNLIPLANLVKEYQAIENKRQLVSEAAYEEQMSKLKEFQLESYSPEANDVNDIKELSKFFSAIAKAGEYADEQQKTELLSDSFVQATFERARLKASEYESEGKWLDAYLVCYSWLQSIDNENEEYSDYAEQLLDKANIVASFQDSPCETSEERYTGIKKKMFIRTIDALNYNYVSVMDYSEMAEKALERCELLAEVITISFEEISKTKTGSSLSEGFFSPPDEQQLKRWLSGLNLISNSLNQSFLGISKDKFIDIFESVLELNEITVRLPRSVLISQFAEATLSALDPYTTMIWPRNVEEFDKIMTNEFTGIGIASLLYGSLPLKMLPHRGKAKTLGKRIATAGFLGGIFDAPENDTRNRVVSQRPATASGIRVSASQAQQVMTT